MYSQKIRRVDTRAALVALRVVRAVKMQDLLSATLVLRDILSYLVKPVRLVLQIVPSAMSPVAEAVTLALVSRDSISSRMVLILTAIVVRTNPGPAAKPALTP
jgi:hypothetical protein